MADQLSLEPQKSMMPGAGAGVAAVAMLPASVSGIMTEPVPPILELQEPFATPLAPTDVMTRLQAVEDRLAAALLRLESVGKAEGSLAARTDADSQPTSSWLSQFLSVIVSGPVNGFLLILLLVLAATARGWWVLQGATRWL